MISGNFSSTSMSVYRCSAIPLAIFQSEESIKRHYLKKWLKAPALDSFDIREVNIFGSNS